MTQKVSKNSYLFSEKSDKVNLCVCQIHIEDFALMNHQPFFALLKVKVNSVCHKKIIDCLQKKNEQKKKKTKNSSVNIHKGNKINK